MRLDVATTADVDRLTDLWVALAADQRAHGSHLAAEGNRSAMHRAIASAVVEDRIVVARPETDDDEPNGVHGFVMFTIEHGIYAQDVTRGRIQNLYVEPTVRNRTLGTARNQALGKLRTTRRVEERPGLLEFRVVAGVVDHVERPVVSSARALGNFESYGAVASSPDETRRYRNLL